MGEPLRPGLRTACPSRRRPAPPGRDSSPTARSRRAGPGRASAPVPLPAGAGPQQDGPGPTPPRQRGAGTAAEDGGGGRGRRRGVGVGAQRAAGHGAGGARYGPAPGPRGGLQEAGWQPWRVRPEVRIALQLDDGSRLQDTFLCQQTLWELLNHFAEIRELMEQHGELSPVCIYMRDEISGKDALEKTTLKSLGLIGGTAIIRVVMKKCSSSGGAEVVGATVPCNEPTVRRGSMEEAADVPLPQANTFPKDLEHRDVAISLNSSTHKQDLIKDSHASLEELRHSPEPEPTPFVPFFGDGEHLGNPPVAVPSSKLPTTFSSPGGPSKPKKSKNSQELQKEQEQLVEREPLICHLDLLEQFSDGPEELPDEFFEVTVDDVRKRLAQLQNERKRLEEAPLMTKSLKESQLKEKLERYPKVVLRVRFPDRHVLQGFFHPTETVGILRNFVRSHLADAELPFYLFVAPPRIVLNDESLTLFEAKLFPAAVIHFGSEECRACYLKSDLLGSAVSPSAADLLVARSLVPSASSTLASVAPSLSAPEVGSEKKTTEQPEAASAQAAPQVFRKAPGKIPKWLKLPGGKR
ncbi:tether containing UBX domain for GLUT4 isoform X2 [Poecile atricapillus]|uniref:tether containing UBX domain for GLUT4 isoform X2 n=1 Tax=Poecile atricapillus TaxID=48891 RepID=UPI0027385440|nr:tether containing UBX domain for GLUT4 isoform X2 [Poecile atricapillus]